MIGMASIERQQNDKELFSIKTGHGPSDEYFKNLAVWHDIDLVKAFFIGALISPIILFLIWELFN